MNLIEQIKVKDLTPYASNSRTHSLEQVDQIAASIKEFGFTNPVLIDANGIIIAGHGRVMAAKKLGLDLVPCLRLDHLTPTQIRAYVIADNKLALNAGWDESLLAKELETLKDDIDLTVIGFNESELLEIIGMTEELGKLKELTIQEPPKMTWVLIGIPTIEFGSINKTIEDIAKTPSTLVEITSNDG